MNNKIAEVAFTTYAQSVARVLDELDAGETLARQSLVILKPNLVNTSPPPVTTPVEFCHAVAQYVRQHTDSRLVIAEGTGDPGVSTQQVFEHLGYADLARDMGLELFDLNTAPTRKLENPARPVFPVMHLPELVFEGFLISLPVLKAHSLALITGALKNMMGLAPPEHYKGKYGIWNKAEFHGRMQRSVADLVSYRSPDLSIMDATRPLAEYHLGGAIQDPPANLILASFDPLGLDRRGAEILGLDWQTIGHLQGPV